VLATLRAQGYSATTGELDAGGRRLALRATGLRVSASDEAGRRVAELRRGWTGTRGTIELPGGERVAWARLGGRHRRVTLADQAGSRLARLETTNRLTRFEADVRLDPAAWARPDLVTLLGVAWFALVAMRNQVVLAR
jgi:hypothetical protein